jgi:hypothetical protein
MHSASGWRGAGVLADQLHDLPRVVVADTSSSWISEITLPKSAEYRWRRARAASR